MRKTLIISDNSRILEFLLGFVGGSDISSYVTLAHSPRAPREVVDIPGISCVDLKRAGETVASEYQMIISAHCKQIFPSAVFERCECINVHPGFNPETRGWFPQVWAILYGHKTGITVHRIDGQLDHGEIIDRVEVPVYSWDTSFSAYNRVLDTELDWLRVNLANLINGGYLSRPMIGVGNLFLKKDFDALCEIDLESTLTFKEAIDRLRALSFEGYNNAYFVDQETGSKVYLQLHLQRESEQ